MLLKYKVHDYSEARPVGVSMFPSLLPRALFEEAEALQPIYNRLYAAVSNDEEWLFGVLEGMIQDGSFAAELWHIHEMVKKEGYIQRLTLGLFRSDYMVHVDGKRTEGDNRLQGDVHQDSPELSLKQVEFNTYSVAGGTHSNKTADLHQHLQRVGAYALPQTRDRQSARTHPIAPKNHTIASLVRGLEVAHNAYGAPKSGQASVTGILFIVQPRNLNICDERPLEYALWDHDPPIPAYRTVFGEEFLAHATLTPSRELLYHPPSSQAPIEVSVAYLRAGYDPEEYTQAGCLARLEIERSRAIKCPSILCHLATFKKVQQELARPGVLTKFLSHAEAAFISKTFAPMYPLDGVSVEGRQGRILACDELSAANFVLKPSLEGGGHNVYGADIPTFLDSVPESEWHSYILMEMIDTLLQRNVLVMPTEIDPSSSIYARHQVAAERSTRIPLSLDIVNKIGGTNVSELGIFGVCLWGRGDVDRPNMFENFLAGWSLKTKPESVQEMSVVKGYGCFSSLYLLDEKTRWSITTEDGRFIVRLGGDEH